MEEGGFLGAGVGDWHLFIRWSAVNISISRVEPGGEGTSGDGEEVDVR